MKNLWMSITKEADKPILAGEINTDDDDNNNNNEINSTTLPEGNEEKSSSLMSDQHDQNDGESRPNHPTPDTNYMDRVTADTLFPPPIDPSSAFASSPELMDLVSSISNHGGGGGGGGDDDDGVVIAESVASESQFGDQQEQEGPPSASDDDESASDLSMKPEGLSDSLLEEVAPESPMTSDSSPLEEKVVASPPQFTTTPSTVVEGPQFTSTPPAAPIAAATEAPVVETVNEKDDDEEYVQVVSSKSADNHNDNMEAGISSPKPDYGLVGRANAQQQEQQEQKQSSETTEPVAQGIKKYEKKKLVLFGQYAAAGVFALGCSHFLINTLRGTSVENVTSFAPVQKAPIPQAPPQVVPVGKKAAIIDPIASPKVERYAQEETILTTSPTAATINATELFDDEDLLIATASSPSTTPAPTTTWVASFLKPMWQQAPMEAVSDSPQCMESTQVPPHKSFLFHLSFVKTMVSMSLAAVLAMVSFVDLSFVKSMVPMLLAAVLAMVSFVQVKRICQLAPWKKKSRKQQVALKQYADPNFKAIAATMDMPLSEMGRRSKAMAELDWDAINYEQLTAQEIHCLLELLQAPSYNHSIRKTHLLCFLHEHYGAMLRQCNMQQLRAIIKYKAIRTRGATVKEQLVELIQHAGFTAKH